MARTRKLSADDADFLDEVEKVKDLLVKSNGFSDLTKPLSTNMTFSLLAEFYVIARQAGDRRALELQRSIDELKSRPSLCYRGVWDASTVYREGDVVSHGGSAWHCQVEATGVKPDESNGVAWRLMVKRGQNGRDGRP